MLPRDEILFLKHAARELRSMAKRVPDIADELRKLANELNTRIRRDDHSNQQTSAQNG